MVAPRLVHAKAQSSHIHQPLAGHVITGDLSIITNPKLRAVFEKGPKFREPRIV